MFDRAVVDSVAFARESGEMHGTAAIESLFRVHDALFDQSGEVAYTLIGFVNQDSKPALRLMVAGDLMLSCQRCLGPVDFRFHSVRNFVLIPPGETLGDPAEEKEDLEQIRAEPNFDVIALVEDEIILGLPMVASHDEGACAAPTSGRGAGKRESPFSVLAILKRQ